MAITHTIQNSTRTIFVKYEGAITPGDVLNFFDQFEGRLERYPNYGEVVDFEDVSRVSMSSGQLYCIYALVHGIYLRSAPHKNIALFAPDGPASGPVSGLVDYFSRRPVAPEMTLLKYKPNPVDWSCDALNLPYGRLN